MYCWHRAGVKALNLPFSNMRYLLKSLISTKVLSSNIIKRTFTKTTIVNGQADSCVIGMREIVGHGINGQPIYVDITAFPYPAIRFREISPTYKALKEKEKGDWRSLTIEEKKTLYRVSFCQTFAEIEAPTGRWKVITGSTLILLSASILLFLFIKKTCYGPMPESFSNENRIAQLRRMLALQMNPITGISSKWDYENEKWK